MHEHLRRRGRESRLLAAPPFPHHDVPWPPEAHARVADAVAGEVVVLQKIHGPNAEALREALRGKAAVVYAQADLAPDNPLPLRCDAVVASSRPLANWHEERGVPAAHVPDPAELWLDPRPPRRGRVRLCWVAHRKNLATLEPLRALLAEPALADYELVTVSNDDRADVLWSEEAVRRVLAESDVGVVPVREGPAALMASANRVTSLMAAALPVVADRLPAYEDVVEHGRTGFLCDSADDWRRALVELLDPGRRLEVAAEAREAVDPAFRPETTGEAWLRVLDGLAVPPGRGGRAGRVRAEAAAAYARAGLEGNQRLPVVLGQAARTLGSAGVAGALAGELARPVARRLRAAVARRV